MSAAYAAYLGTARTGAPWWRAPFAFLALLGIWVAGSFITMLLAQLILWTLSPDQTYFEIVAFTYQAMSDGVVGWSGALITLSALLSLACLWPASWAAQLIVGSGLGRLLSLRGKLRWRLLAKGFSACLPIFILIMAISIAFEPAQYSLADRLGELALYLPILSLALFLQASGEELVFRGWLVQQLGRVWTHPLFTFGLSALLFALLYGANNEVLALGPLAFLIFFAASLAPAYAVWRTGGLEIAFAFHTVNNVIASLIAFPDTDQITPLSGFSVFNYAGDPFANPWVIWVSLGSLLVSEGLILALLFWNGSPLKVTPEDLGSRG